MLGGDIINQRISLDTVCVDLPFNLQKDDLKKFKQRNIKKYCYFVYQNKLFYIAFYPSSNIKYDGILKIQFSVPKIIFNFNLRRFNLYYAQDVISRVEKELLTIFNRSILISSARVSRIDINKDFYFNSSLSAGEFLSFILKSKLPRQKAERMYSIEEYNNTIINSVQKK